MNLPRLSKATFEVIAAAGKLSNESGHHFLGVEHLFVELARDPSSTLAKTLSKYTIDQAIISSMLPAKVDEQGTRAWGEELIYTPRSHKVLQLAGKIAGQKDQGNVEPRHVVEAIFREGRSVPLRVLRAKGVDPVGIQVELDDTPEPTENPTPYLDRFGRDITALARSGSLTPVIGRKKEINLLSQVLLRKNKNNPVLTGDAGVGKTAVVEGFAQSLVDPACPEPLRKCRIVELSITSIVAGTKFRGEFEERMVNIKDEASSDPNIILFLDELHTIVGAGSTGTDSLDVSNILKPELARGTLRCIGATTISEYRKTIERDAALDRRFEKILVEEPNRADALQILQGVSTSLEVHHQVKINPDAIEAALDLTVRHLPDRRLPDKAIDALDQSCARRRLQTLCSPESDTECSTNPLPIEAKDVTRTVSQWTGIPLERLTSDAKDALLNVEAELQKLVVGQDEAVSAVSRAIVTARAGLAAPNRPIGVFLFMGPTGVGKTELARSLAKVLFSDEKRLVRFDCSEFSEPHGIAKLIGAPPGYVGYEEEGLLISALRTHPHSIVLFDEIEKAHPQLFDLFLQIFDEGRLSGSHGHTADFTQSMIIMTSNLTPRPGVKKTSLGFRTGPEEEAVPVVEFEPREALMGYFRPELVNRIDQILVFEQLGEESLNKIVDHFLEEIKTQLEARSIEIRLDKKVYSYLISMAESHLYGARELRRVVDATIRQPLADKILREDIESATIRVTVRKTGLNFIVK